MCVCQGVGGGWGSVHPTLAYTNSSSRTLSSLSLIKKVGVFLLSQVPFKLSPHQVSGSLNLCRLGSLLTYSQEPLSYSVIKSHITNLILLFFFFPDLMKTKHEEVGMEERRGRSELLNGDTQSEYLICWFYWIKGEKVVLVCCLPVKQAFFSLTGAFYYCIGSRG